MNWEKAAKFIVRKIETQLRCLVGEVAFVSLTERQDKALASLVVAHRGSSQNMNIAYVKEIDRVVIMSHNPKVVILQGPSGRIEVIRELSETGLTVTSKAPIGGMFAQEPK